MHIAAKISSWFVVALTVTAILGGLMQNGAMRQVDMSYSPISEAKTDHWGWTAPLRSVGPAEEARLNDTNHNGG